MADLPIPAEAIEAAAANMEAVDSGRTNLYRESWMVLSRAALAAAFDALGVEVEKRGRMFPAKREGILEHRDTEYRLVSRWFKVKP